MPKVKKAKEDGQSAFFKRSIVHWGNPSLLISPSFKNIYFSSRTCNGIHYLSFYFLNGAACLDSKINITRARFSSLVAQLTAFCAGYCFICISYCYCGCYGCKTVFLYFFTMLIRLCFFHILYKPHTNFLAESFGNLFIMIKSLLLMIYEINNVHKT